MLGEIINTSLPNIYLDVVLVIIIIILKFSQLSLHELLPDEFRFRSVFIRGRFGSSLIVVYDGITTSSSITRRAILENHQRAFNSAFSGNRFSLVIAPSTSRLREPLANLINRSTRICLIQLIFFCIQTYVTYIFYRVFQFIMSKKRDFRKLFGFSDIKRNTIQTTINIKLKMIKHLFT